MTSGVEREKEEIEAYKRQILEYLQQTPGGTLAGACAKVSVGYSTAYVWRNDDHEWSAKLDTARAISNDLGGDFAEGKLMACINNSEFPAIKFYLGTKHKNRGYVERQEQTGADGAPIKTESTASVAISGVPDLVKTVIQQVRDEY